MAKKGGRSNHPILGYFGGIIFAVICLIIIFVLGAFYINDTNRHQPQQSRQLEDAAVSSAEGYYQRDAGPLGQYVKARTDGDLKSQEPQINEVKDHLKQISPNINHPTQVKDVTLDDSGNGTFVQNGHKYLFQLEDLNFVPHNSAFYQKNHVMMQTIIQKEINNGNGNFYVTRAKDNKINLYEGHHLVADQFIRKGIAYVPDDSMMGSPSHEAMVATEHHARSNGSGFWKMNNTMVGSKSNQSYNVSAEKGQHVPTVSGDVGQAGGKSILQEILSWFDQH